MAGLAGAASAVVAGYDHSCALLASGDVQCWGANDHGQLGDGTTIDRNVPVPVAGLAGGVTAVAVSSSVTSSRGPHSDFTSIA